MGRCKRKNCHCNSCCSIGPTGQRGPIGVTGPTGQAGLIFPITTSFPITGDGGPTGPVTLIDGSIRADSLYYNGLNWEISRVTSAATITVGVGGQVSTLTDAFLAGCNQVRIISDITENALSFGALVGDVVVYLDGNVTLTLIGNADIPDTITSFSIFGVSPGASSAVNFDTPGSYFTRSTGPILMQLEKIHITNTSALAATSFASPEDFQIRMWDCRITANGKSFLLATISINLEMSDCTMDSTINYSSGIIDSRVEAGHVILRNVRGNDITIMRFWTIDMFTENVSNFDSVEIADGSHFNLNQESASSTSVEINHSSSNTDLLKQIVGGGVVGNYGGTGVLTLTRWMFINISLDLNADQLIMNDCMHIGSSSAVFYFITSPNDNDAITRCTFENVNVVNNSGYFQCNFNGCFIGGNSITNYIAPIQDCIFKNCTFGGTVNFSNSTPFNFFQGGPPWNNTWMNCRMDDCIINLSSSTANTVYQFSPNVTSPNGPNHNNIIWNNTYIMLRGGNNQTLEMGMNNSQMNNTVILTTSGTITSFTLRFANTRVGAVSPTNNIINGFTINAPVTFTIPTLDIRTPFTVISNIMWPFTGANINLTNNAGNSSISNSVIGTPGVGTGNITGVLTFEPLVVNTRTRTLTNTIASNSPTF